MFALSYGPTLSFSEEVHASKYRSRNETFYDMVCRIAATLSDNEDHRREIKRILLQMAFLPAGRIQRAIGAAQKVTAYNCYVSGTIEDDSADIMEKAKEALLTMRMGGGIGYDFSTLRPRGALIRSLNSPSSGPVSFMGIFNATCKTVSSAGNRRGAQMGVLRVDHPDIEEFVAAKQNETELTAFNISVAATDEFMKAVIAGNQFQLKFNGEVYSEIDASALWDKIMRSTWDWADPGVLFIDRINAMNNLHYCETISATNPCFPGDVRVWTAYGPKRFDELAAEGKTIPVLTQLGDGTFAFRDMVNPRKTRRNASLIEVVVRGSGRKRGSISKVRCTPNHEFFLTDGRRVAAKDLSAGDRIYSAYERQANQKGYRLVSGGHDLVMGHHLAAEYRYGRRPNYPHEHAHHVNEVKDDNRPENVVILPGSEHTALHMTDEANPMRRFPERNHFKNNPRFRTLNGRWRDDVDDEDLIKMRQNGMSYAAIAKAVGCSKYTAMRRLGWERNHEVIGVREVAETADVYCGTVPATGRFFILCDDDEGLLVSNCGEQPLPPYGACLLGSFNLTRYLVNYSGRWMFDLEAFRADIPPVVRAMDNVIENTIYPLKAQELEATSKRRMGLGVTGVANALEVMGHPYASDGYIEAQNAILETLRDEAYRASAKLAAEKGAFPKFDRDKYLDSAFVQTLPGDIRDLIAEHGIRNSHLLSIAPTGTISLSADNISSGIEPVFSHEYSRTFISESGPVVEHVTDWAYREHGVEGRTADELEPEEHVQVLVEAQRYVDSAVSKTCNVGPGVSWERFKDIYLQAWRGGAKGCTTFRPAGKKAGVLSKIDSKLKKEESLACRIDPVTGLKTCDA